MIDPTAQLEELTIPAGAGPDDARIQITKTIPAGLASYYATLGFDARSVVLYWADGGDLAWYEIDLTATSAIYEAHASGWYSVVTAAVTEINFYQRLFADSRGIVGYGVQRATAFGWGLPGRAPSVDENARFFDSVEFNVAGPASIDTLRHVSDEQLTASTRAVAAYANLTNIAGCAFVAPDSGIVTIHWLALHNSNTAGAGGALAPRVGEGTTVGAGTLFLAAADADATSYQVAAINQGARIGGHKTVTGLTPRADYNVSIQGRAVTAGTATFDDIHTTVVPSP